MLTRRKWVWSRLLVPPDFVPPIRARCLLGGTWPRRRGRLRGRLGFWVDRGGRDRRWSKRSDASFTNNNEWCPVGRVRFMGHSLLNECHHRPAQRLRAANGRVGG